MPPGGVGIMNMRQRGRVILNLLRGNDLKKHDFMDAVNERILQPELLVKIRGLGQGQMQLIRHSFAKRKMLFHLQLLHVIFSKGIGGPVKLACYPADQDRTGIFHLATGLP